MNGIAAEITGFFGVCANPHRIVAHTDGGIRQRYENTCLGHPPVGCGG
ncbi:hypothetical protein ACIQF6_02140 [Kitasatospora sp. NPDC092948]